MKRAVVTVALVLAATPATAQAPGLYWESTTAYGVTEVRRMRDTTNGVVCYVAVNLGGYIPGRNPAISCVKP